MTNANLQEPKRSEIILAPLFLHRPIGSFVHLRDVF